ncbi:NUDIX hydrolase [Mycolicibacterium chlorophenolicum]|uniref:NUDIX domain protein n=1 Tax=Mycolicibacterium chlorophenolicum TaxID=37916 RepID=A0A0J6VNV3_9MYCO|nr:NUDIX hydrolase [Mycolicibacterium chlorophenolicum]KMO71182.1 NUDIX domain protein [Mycolicibacterium chlorophenolicum]
MSLHQSAIDTLTAWRPADPAQESMRHALLAFLDANAKACLRESVPGHITGSALVVNHAGTHALLTLHPRFQRWLQLGGHCEPEDATLVAAALREATEESGIEGLFIDELPTAVHVHPVTCSLGVPTRHLDVQFVARAPKGAEAERSEESLDLRWWPLDDLPDSSDFGLTQLATLARVHLTPAAE